MNPQQRMNWRAILIAVAATFVAAILTTLIVAVEAAQIRGILP